jgi:hypothetical protein
VDELDIRQEMKLSCYLILFGLQSLILCFAEQSVIQMEMRFKDVPKKWFSFIEESDRKRWTNKEGMSPFPSKIVMGLDTPVAYSIKTESPLPDAKEGDPVIVSGIFVNLTLKKIDQQLFLAGTVVLKRLAETAPDRGAVRMESQEILIRTKIENSKPLVVPLEDGGKMVIIPTLLDPTGQSLEEKKVEQ